MQATSVFGKTSSPSKSDSAKSPVAGTINSRHCTSVPALAPRISCHSRWWNALGQGGIKGWYKWLAGVQKYERLSVAERLDKPVQSASAICTALKQAAINKKISSSEFNKLISKAHWYDVDVDNVIQSAFQDLNKDRLNEVRNACVKKPSLSWLAKKIDLQIEELEFLEKKLTDGIYQSAMLSTDGFLVNGPEQAGFWEEMDRGFNSAGVCNLHEQVIAAISKDSIWKLLPFAELDFHNIATRSPVLQEVCRQAWKKLSQARTMDFGQLTDGELSRFLVLIKQAGLKHHASACNDALRRRAHNAKCSLLAAHLEKRASASGSSSTAKRETSPLSSEDDLFEGLDEKSISLATLQVVAKLGLEDVVRLSKLESSQFSDMWLNEVAKAQLNSPCIALMDNATLISYLQAGTAQLSASVRKQLVGEAGKRAENAYKDSYACLQAGLESDSCNRLVLKVLEYSERLALGAALQDAAGLENSSDDIPPGFSAILLNADKNQVMRARNLAITLREGNLKIVGKRLSRAIRNGNSSIPLGRLSARDEQFMAKAVSQHTPGGADAYPRRPATKTSIELGEKFSDLFNEDMATDDNFRKVRTPAGEMLPVCGQFIKDQRSTDMQIDGKPIFSAHVADHTERARIFMTTMRAVKGITEEQIMTASRIASQNTGAALVKLARNESLFALTTEEALEAGVTDAGLGLPPTGLDRLENFVSNLDGSLTAHVRLFNENVEKWSGTSSGPVKIAPITIATDPEESSFSAELRFEIDPAGKIRDVFFEDWAVERKIVPADS